MTDIASYAVSATILLFIAWLALRGPASALLNLTRIRHSQAELRKGDKIYWGTPHHASPAVVTKVSRSSIRFFVFEYTIITEDGTEMRIETHPEASVRMATEEDYNAHGPQILERPITKKEAQHMALFRSYWGKTKPS